MNLNLILVTIVFVIGYGWGAATATILYYGRSKKILDLCTKILRLCGDVIASDEKTRKLVCEYAEITHKTVNASFAQNEKIVQGLHKIVEAVKEENHEQK